ncbi:MAG: thiamine-phosphate kinase [Deltaproteobacteria bacterium]|nr:thiamine-phosphate kinase [Deltaproteobacteria bacterium]
MQTLQQFGEKKLHRFLGQFKGVGDDAAVIPFQNSQLVFTTDALEEELHFSFRWMAVTQLASKLLAVNLSDLAAMGAQPRWALLSLALPKKTPILKLKTFFKALQKYCQQFGVQLIGGDTDASDKWRLSLTLIGEVKNAIYRSGAKVGEDLWVTGNPGHSALGLYALQQNLDQKKFRPYIQKHLCPLPRLQEGHLLSTKKIATAMIDVSDGLLLDLERLCEASKVGAEIKLPQNPSWPSETKDKEQEFVACGGEDYELLFSSSEKNRKAIMGLFQKLKTPLHFLGKIKVQRYGISALDLEGKEIKFSIKGYQHF